MMNQPGDALNTSPCRTRLRSLYWCTSSWLAWLVELEKSALMNYSLDWQVPLQTSFAFHWNWKCLISDIISDIFLLWLCYIFLTHSWSHGWSQGNKSESDDIFLWGLALNYISKQWTTPLKLNSSHQVALKWIAKLYLGMRVYTVIREYEILLLGEIKECTSTYPGLSEIGTTKG